MGEMQSWGEILCENRTKSVIALKYIMRLQSLYMKALWNHPLNMSDKKIILAEHYSVTSHRTNTATKNNFIILWRCCERKIGAPCLFLLHAPAEHRCIRREGSIGGCCFWFTLPSSPAVLARCLWPGQSQAILYFFCFMLDNRSFCLLLT